ncbi:MAG: DUF4365 domain-containing protein [Leucobacter sp.]
MTTTETLAAAQAAVLPPSRLLRPADKNFSDNGRKGRYGVAYLRSLAAHAGVGLQETSPDEDVDAVDVTLKFGRASAEVQVKCSGQFKVGNNPATLQLEPGWVEKWTESLVPVYVILVKVPSVVSDWIEGKPSSTVHRTVAFGKRFDPAIHKTTMKFVRADRITAETLYDWRDEVYDFHKNRTGGAA